MLIGKKPLHVSDNILKSFTALLVNFTRDKFIWVKTKNKVDSISEEHDNSIAENYVFDEILGHHDPRTEYEKQAKFNYDDYKPTLDEIRCFQSLPEEKKHKNDDSLDYTLASGRHRVHPQFKPQGCNR